VQRDSSRPTRRGDGVWARTHPVFRVAASTPELDAGDLLDMTNELDDDLYDTDVLVVGAGPVGVAMGLFGAFHGLRVEAYDSNVEVYPLPRAIVMDDEVQRLFSAIGLGKELVALTTPMKGAEFVSASRERIIGIDLPDGVDWPLGHCPVVSFHQPSLEAMLRDAALRAGVDLHLGTTVVDIDISAPGRVKVIVRNADGTERVRTTRWLVAADGASSQIRKRVGIALTDLGFDQEWVVVDVEMVANADLPLITQQVCDAARVVTYVPGHENWRRWEFQVQDGETGTELSRPENLRRLLSSWMDPNAGNVARSAVYRFHATVAESMRSGDVFLAGDSAHQMPPFLGQGLCSGVRDAANLAWKLARVHRGESTVALLETYDLERRPHSTGTVLHAIDTGMLIDQLAATGDGDTASGYGGAREAPIINDGFVVPGHPLVGRPMPNPRMGDRSRLDDHLGRGFTVVAAPSNVQSVTRVFAQDDLATLNATVVAVEPERLPFLIDENLVAVVRPDRLIGAVLDVTSERAVHDFASLCRRWG
jgi:3-(3-hydroxy-phenyl)propionate hydroxylase